MRLAPDGTVSWTDPTGRNRTTSPVDALSTVLEHLVAEPRLPPAWRDGFGREHRGHRLGMAVKIRGLQELAKVAPRAKRIQTTNAEQNAQMVAVNVEVGFRKVEAVVAYQRHVAG